MKEREVPGSAEQEAAGEASVASSASSDAANSSASSASSAVRPDTASARPRGRGEGAPDLLSLPDWTDYPALSLSSYARPEVKDFQQATEDLYTALRNHPAKSEGAFEEFERQQRLFSDAAQTAMLGYIEGGGKGPWEKELSWYEALSEEFHRLTYDALTPLLASDAIAHYARRFERAYFYRLQRRAMSLKKSASEIREDIAEQLLQLQEVHDAERDSEPWLDWAQIPERYQTYAEAMGFSSVFESEMQDYGIRSVTRERLATFLEELRLRFVPLYEGLYPLYAELDDAAPLAALRDQVMGSAEPLLYLPTYGTNASPRETAEDATRWFYQLSSELMAAELSQVLGIQGNFLRELQKKGYLRLSIPHEDLPFLPASLDVYRLQSCDYFPELFYLPEQKKSVLYGLSAKRLLDAPRWFMAYSELSWQISQPEVAKDELRSLLQMDSDRQTVLWQMMIGEALTWEAISENYYALSGFDQGRGEAYVRYRFLQLIEEILLAAAVYEWTILNFRGLALDPQDTYEIWPQLLREYGLEQNLGLADLSALQLTRGPDGQIEPDLMAVLAAPFAVVPELLGRLMGLAFWDHLRQKPRVARHHFRQFMGCRLRLSGEELLDAAQLPNPLDPVVTRRLAYQLAYKLEA